MILVFLFYLVFYIIIYFHIWLSRFLPANICGKVAMLHLQPRGGHVQGKGILIAGMAPDLSYDNTCSERLNFSGMK